MMTLLLYSLIGGLLSLVGGCLLLWQEKLAKKIITPLLAFAAGAFITTSLLDLLPESIEMVSEPHPLFLSTVIGFTLFFVLERVLMRCSAGAHARHEHSDHTESLPVLLILGDSIHNFLDGVVIALSFVANPALGLTTTLAVAAHELPQEIGDFSILLHQGWSRTRILTVNIFQSLLTIPGVVVGYYAGSTLEAYLPYLLAGAAGIFLYLGASDLIPEMHHRSEHKHIGRVILPFIASVLAVSYLVSSTH